MTTVKFARLFVAALALTLLSGGAQAAYVEIAPALQDNDGAIDLPPAGFTATYSNAAAVSSIWFSATEMPQSPESVAASITDQFDITLTKAGFEDRISSGSISLGSSFNVLAVHLGGQLGGNELLFFFNSPITDFDVNTFSAGGSSNLSNFRVYNTGVVPVPAAVWLFGSALLGFTGLRRR